jgi:hypothetical protein
VPPFANLFSSATRVDPGLPVGTFYLTSSFYEPLLRYLLGLDKDDLLL